MHLDNLSQIGLPNMWLLVLIAKKSIFNYFFIKLYYSSCSTFISSLNFQHCCFSFTEAATRGVLYKKGVLKNFAKFTGKHLCQSLFLIESQAPPGTLLKRRLWHRCFPLNFAKFLRIPFLQNTSERLPLQLNISFRCLFHFRV